MDSYNVVYYKNGNPIQTTIQTDEVEVITDGNGIMTAIFFEDEDLVAAFSNVISIERIDNEVE